MKIIIFSATGFLPSALAATSLSRMARSERPNGELTIREATNQTSTTDNADRPM